MKFIIKKWKNQSYGFWAEKKEGILWIHFKGHTYTWTPEKYKHSIPQDISQNKKQHKNKKTSSRQKPQEKVFSPMPGKIQRITVKPGEGVKKGETLFILSAMKIEYSFQAETSGSIKKIKVKEGDFVKKGDLIMELNYTGF